MAEQQFGLISGDRPKPLTASYSNRDDDSAGFMMAYKLATGTLRGAQGVGGQGVKIDSDNRRITITGADGGAVGIGTIPGSTTNENGFFMLDSTGAVVMKIVGQTIFGFDPNNAYNNNVQIIKLSNGEYGAAFAKDGEELTTALGS